MPALKLGGLLFEFLAVKQRGVPAPFQCGGHQSLRRVDLLIASLGKRGLILGALEPHLPLASDGMVARFQLLESCQSQFELCRLHSLENFPSDSGIKQVTTEAHAAFAGQTVAVQRVALIAGIETAVAGIAYGERSSTLAAHQ